MSRRSSLDVSAAAADRAATKVTSKQMKLARAKFDELDADNSKTLAGPEMKKLADWLFDQFDQVQEGDDNRGRRKDRFGKQLLSKLDEDGDGSLDFEEFGGWFVHALNELKEFKSGKHGTDGAARAAHVIANAEIYRYVPESLRKKFARDKKVAADAIIAKAAAKKANKKKRQQIFKNAEKYEREYRQIARDLIQKRRVAKAHGNFFLEPEGKLAVVIRIRGINGVAPKTRKILQLLRLRSINNCVFVKLNKATLHMLRLVEPYIAYGYPNMKAVRELVYKRGFGKVNRQRIALSDNSIIEGELAGQGVICMEDLIHEIFTVGPNFKKVNNFIWPFRLNCPTGGFSKKLLHFNEGGAAGNREHLISGLIHQMI